VCVVYPDAEFKATSFGAAWFQVREIFSQREMMTADIRVTPYPRKDGDTVSNWLEFWISAAHPTEIISGIEFVHGTDVGAATGHWSGTDLYRRFRKQNAAS
jgi:hypothetical protein